MIEAIVFEESAEFSSAKDLVMNVKLAFDGSPEGLKRHAQAKMLLGQLLALATKRGRPSQSEDLFDEAA